MSSIHHKIRTFSYQSLKLGAALIVSLIMVGSSSPLLYALDDEQRQIFINNIEYFDVNQTPICTVTDVSDGNLNLTGDNKKDAWDFFTKSMGLPATAAAGILGNFSEESGVDPAIQEGGGHSPAYPVPGRGFGIAQWTPAGRQNGLKALAARLNKDVRDLGVQLLYVKQELEDDYPTALEAIRKATTAGQAAFDFHRIYEVSSDTRAEIREREDAANDFMRLYGGGTTPTQGPDAGSGEANCTDGSSSGGLTGDCQVYGPDGKIKVGQMSGNEAILECARLFDPYGYDLGAGHQDPASWMKKWEAAGEFKNKSFRRILDCSSIEMMAIYLAFGVSMQFSTRSMDGNKNLRRINPEQAQPGDLMWRSGHTEIATQKGGKRTFGAHTSRLPPARQISDSSGGGNWAAAYVYIGEGSTRK